MAAHCSILAWRIPWTEGPGGLQTMGSQRVDMTEASERACTKSLNHVQIFATPWTVAHQAPLSTGFSRQEYWSGLPCPPPGDLPDPGTEQEASCTFCIAGEFFTTEPLWEPQWPFMLSQMAVFPSF